MMRAPDSGKRWHVIVLGAILSAACVGRPVYGSPAVEGGSGIFFTRSAETVEKGELEYFVLGRMNSYDMPAKSDLDVILSPGVSYGLSDTSELSCLASAVGNETTSKYGLQMLECLLKARYFGGEEGQWSGAYTLFAGAGDGQAAISSGKPRYGAELDFSYQSGSGIANFVVGVEQSDTKESPTSYVSEQKIKAGAGLGFSTSEDTLVSFEFVATKGLKTNDEDIFLIPALRHRIGSLEYGVGVSFGLPEDRSAPQRSYFAQLSYDTGRPKVRRTRMETAVEALRADTQEIARSVERQNEQLANLETKLLNMGAVAPVAETGVAAPVIEIVAGEGLSGIGEQVSNRLRGNGYRIGQVRSSTVPPIRQTWIYYRPGLTQEAVKLGNAIPKNQNVSKDSNLPLDVDIRIVIGEDLSNTPTRTAAVEILANPDVASAIQQVSETVRRAGYHINNTRENAAATTESTSIRYRLGFAGDAIRVGKLLPKNQFIEKDTSLPGDVDTRIRVGKDQLGKP